MVVRYCPNIPASINVIIFVFMITSTFYLVCKGICFICSNRFLLLYHIITIISIETEIFIGVKVNLHCNICTDHILYDTFHCLLDMLCFLRRKQA